MSQLSPEEASLKAQWMELMRETQTAASGKTPTLEPATGGSIAHMVMPDSASESTLVFE